MHNERQATQGNNVVDPESGVPRLLSHKCGTCIYRANGLLSDDRHRRDVIADQAVANDSWVICHDTLTHGRNQLAPGEQAICRGFWDVRGNESAGCRLAHYFGPVEVPPPGDDSASE